MFDVGRSMFPPNNRHAADYGSSLFSVEYGAQQNSKLQAPSSREALNLKLQTRARAMWWSSGGALRFGAWNFSGAWSLGFEASQPGYSTENSEEL
jgi:hypothetical protein